MVEWSSMTLRVPISAACWNGISSSNQGVRTMRGAVLVLVARAPGHRVADAVDQADAAPGAVERNGHRLVRDEQGLGRHDGAAGAALRQLVLGALPVVAVFDAGQDQQVHEPFDKRRLARANRADDPDVNAAARSCGDVVKEVELLHAVSPLDLPGVVRRPVQLIFAPGRDYHRDEKAAPEKSRRSETVSIRKRPPEGPAVYPGSSTARGVTRTPKRFSVPLRSRRMLGMWRMMDQTLSTKPADDVDRGQAVEKQRYGQQRRRDDGSQGNVAGHGDDDDEHAHQTPAPRTAPSPIRMPRAVAMPRPPFSFRNSDQLWPATTARAGAGDERVAEAQPHGQPDAQPPFGRIQKQHDQRRQRPQDAHDVGRADVAAADFARMSIPAVKPPDQVAEGNGPDDVTAQSKTK